MLSLLKPQGLSFEDVKDYKYAGVSSIILPSSKILIGTAGKIADAALYESGDLTFDFGNGVAENGLDTGSEVSNQWYALYAVPKAGTKQYQLRASVQPPHQAGGTGPSGFSKYRYLGIFRNGTNIYNTTPNHLPGDITYFNKNKNIMNFTGFNDQGGGLYPQANRHSGVTLFVANTAINGTMMDTINNAYIGFSGASPSGAAKLPYREGLFGFKHYINSASNTASVIISDVASNDRNFFGMVLDTVSNSFTLYFDLQLSLIDWQGSIRSIHATSPNVNRGLTLQRFTDPFTIGGI